MCVFYASLEEDRERLPGSARTAAERYPDEPYRQKLKLIRERLERVGDVRPGGYDDVDDLLEDLEVIAQSLRNNGGESVVEAHVDPLRRQVATFGFSLASLDLRNRFFPRITAEYERATELITTIGRREDLHTRDWLGEALARRNPYVDPLNVLQVYLLQQTHRTDVEERTLRLTVKGIAAGMKNTG